ncbi:MAG TPA: aldehyde ferredoxin oxidoreductase C-terminal domain-containing protein, partial [Thermodesulfobacteriota bacterium]|nr:aldehyde ferredoxin oxidoreductase C-terminal domain-containing protein [Thermodesulfobacteriota bacterium]
NDHYVRMLKALTGWDWTLEETERLGERIYNLERAFNCREGVTRSDDALPFRSSREPIPSGPSQGMHSPPEEFGRMLDEYYRIRGWDSNGVPTLDKLTALGLADEAIPVCAK